MAEKMEDNNKDNKNTSNQAVINTKGKPRYSCKVCTFACNHLQNFRIHLQNFKNHEPSEPLEKKKPKVPLLGANPQTTQEKIQMALLALRPPVPQTTPEKIQNPSAVEKKPVPQTAAVNLQNPSAVEKKPVPQTAAVNLQNTNKGNQNPPLNAVPKLNKNVYIWKNPMLGARPPGPQTTQEKIQNPALGAKSLGPQTTPGKVQNPAMGAKTFGPQTTQEKIQNNNIGNQNAPFKAAANPNRKSRFSWASPTAAENRPFSQTMAVPPIQNNSQGNQMVTPKAGLNPNIKPKFFCTECNFACNFLQNYRVHLHTVHGKTDDESLQIASAMKKEAEEKFNKIKNTVNFKPDNKPKRRAPVFHPGLEYVLEYRFKTKGNQIVTKYFCELCECDTDVDPMVEHLAGFRHRKQYLAREYPYVLKAQAISKEDQSQFIRRMALEIEREEGTKMYMTDPSVWMETMMTLRTADKKLRKKTRWDDDRNDQNRMAKALKFLESFEVDSELEATTVARLCERLTDYLKFYHGKAKEDALFPARVARAQDVALSLMKNAAKQRTPVQNLTQITAKPKMPPQLAPPTLLQNLNLKNKIATQSGFPGTNFQGTDPRQSMPNAPPYPQAQQYPFVSSNEKQGMYGPSMPQMNQTPQKSVNENDDINTLGQEDTKFFKKLMALLEALPQNAPLSEDTQMNSKLLMLKSLLVNQKSDERELANQQLMKQVASMVQDTISAQNASLNQQLMMLMTSQNSTAMVMQTASLRNNPIQLNENSLLSSTSLVPGMQISGNMQTNMNSLVSFNQNLGSQVYGQLGENAPMPMNQNNYQVPSLEMQNYPSTSQNCDNFGYGTSMERNIVPKGDSYIGQHEQNQQPLISNTNVDYEPRAYDKEWDNAYYDNTSAQVSEPRYVDHRGKQAPYTRVCLSPSSPKGHYDDYNDNTRGEIGIEDARRRPSLRSYNSSDWDDQDNDIRYGKRARLEMDNRADRSESYHDQALESLGINTAGMPEELLKRIKGKDLFTASAIISEYSERRSGK
ncbi:uncharacterized protein [Dendropsophus ebraccatus]|uniref:uncharacterized protein isoform X2 n=1 Tax=Dendropsophus ebraccatus TaxID=150705 RepID=UPI0038310D1A